MVNDPTSAGDLLACPRCDKAPLSAQEKGYRCKGCKTRYPSLNGIPWLFAEPDATLAEWRNRLQFALQQIARDAQRMRTEQKSDDVSELTRQRLASLIEANDEHRAALRELLAAVDVQSMQASFESHLALRTRLPSDQGLNTYYANVHRDWAWGDEENAASMAAITTVLDESGSSEFGDTLVLGAGAGRLAYDLHQQGSDGRTVAIDFNPLLLLVAQRLVRGDTLALYEFPIAPRSKDSVAVKQTLAAPAAARDGLHLVLADVLRAPIAKASVDTVVTPWLIDIVSEDLKIFAARINQLLKPGGRWINFGSLAFDHPERSRRYSPDEVLDIVTTNGFDRPAVHEKRIPYMCSPHSRHARQELTFAFAARKSSDVKPAARHKALPDWIVVGKDAVPMTQSFGTQAMTSRVYSFVMSLIDGKRSIEDMAVIFEQQKLMTRKEAVPAIRNFLTRMYEDSQRNANF